MTVMCINVCNVYKEKVDMQNCTLISWLRISKPLKQLIVAANTPLIKIDNINSMKLSRLLWWSQLNHHFNLETEWSGASLISQSPVGPFLGTKQKTRDHIVPAVSFQALVLANYRIVKEVILVISFLCRWFCPAQPVFQKTNNAALK